MTLRIDNLACHAAGYVVGGPEMFVWGMLGIYYQQEGMVMRLGKAEVVNAILNHPQNRFSKPELERAIENLAGAGRNGPMKLKRLLAKATDDTLLPTTAFGVAGEDSPLEPLPAPEKSFEELLEWLKKHQQSRVVLTFKDGYEMRCYLSDVFQSHDARRLGRWVAIIDNGMVQTFDVEEKIIDVQPS